MKKTILLLIIALLLQSLLGLSAFAAKPTPAPTLPPLPTPDPQMKRLADSLAATDAQVTALIKKYTDNKASLITKITVNLATGVTFSFDDRDALVENVNFMVQSVLDAITARKVWQADALTVMSSDKEDDAVLKGSLDESNRYFDGLYEKVRTPGVDLYSALVSALQNGKISKEEKTTIDTAIANVDAAVNEFLDGERQAEEYASQKMAELAPTATPTASPVAAKTPLDHGTIDLLAFSSNFYGFCSLWEEQWDPSKTGSPTKIRDGEYVFMSIDNVLLVCQNDGNMFPVCSVMLPIGADMSSVVRGIALFAALERQLPMSSVEREEIFTFANKNLNLSIDYLHDNLTDIMAGGLHEVPLTGCHYRYYWMYSDGKTILTSAADGFTPWLN